MNRHQTEVIGRGLVRRVLAVLAVAAALVVTVAAPASAHSELVQSDPAPGAVLARAPDRVTLAFTEPVDVANGGVRVFDSGGDRVDSGGADATGRTVTLPVPDLARGAYVVTWRVTSEDAHPISGAFTFQVGRGGAGATSPEVQGLANRLLSEQGGDRVVGVLYGIARFVVFVGLALLVGAVFFAAVVWPDARSSARTRLVVRVGWWSTTVATVVGLLLYGPYVEGLGLGESLSTSLIGDTLDVRFGQVWLARLVLLAAMAPLLVWAFRRDPATGRARPVATWWAPAMLLLVLLLVATPGLAGHAVTGDWATAALFADTIHVLAMALWFGGLVALAAVTLPHDATIAARGAVQRFSTLAFGCLVALIATGAFQTWRQVGSLDALRSTDYGRILIVKIVLVALVVVFAAFSREVVLRLLPPELPGDREQAPEPEPARERAGGPQSGGSRVPVVTGGADDDEPGERARAPHGDVAVDVELELVHLRRAVWAEIVTAILILVATALLVNAAPAKTAVASAGEGGVAGATLRGAGVNVDVTLTPAVAGANDVHVDVSDANGAPKNVTELRVTMALPDRRIAPIEVPLRRLGPGHYLSPGFEVPLAGDWRVTAKPLLSEFRQPTLRGTIEIG